MKFKDFPRNWNQDELISYQNRKNVFNYKKQKKQKNKTERIRNKPDSQIPYFSYVF